MMRGIVAGSFDPITYGHVWLIDQAAKMMTAMNGELIIAIGRNPSKKYKFSDIERREQVIQVLNEHTAYDNCRVEFVGNDFLVNFAHEQGARFIFRGIRNFEDFQYENQLLQINRALNRTIETVFFITPPDMAEVSSSTVKGLVGFNGWEEVAKKYTSPLIIEALKRV